MGYKVQVIGKTLLKSDFETVIVDGRSSKPLGLKRRNPGFYHVELEIIEDDGTIWLMSGLLQHRKVAGILREKRIPETTKARLRKLTSRRRP